MSKKFIIASSLVVVSIILLVAFYLNRNLNVGNQEPSLNQIAEEDKKNKENEVAGDPEFKTGPVCERKGIADLKQVADDSKIVIRNESASKDESAYYNDYLFCESLANDNQSDLDNVVEISDFSQKAYLSNMFNRLNPLNVMLKSDCNSAEVVKAAADYKKATLFPSGESIPANLKNEIGENIKKNLSDVSPSELCGFFKRNSEIIAKLKSQGFCAEYAGCEAILNDSLEACDGIALEGDKGSCKDDVWYLRSINGGNIGDCSNIVSSIKNISCQAHFLGDKGVMCKGIANEIKTAFFCR